MCRQHLLGEHLELHIFANEFARGKKNLSGYIENGLVEPWRLKERHDEIVVEMSKRGFIHRTPLIQPPLSGDLWQGSLNLEFNLYDLAYRCEKCRDRMRGASPPRSPLKEQVT